jgi:hypothetical protein
MGETTIKPLKQKTQAKTSNSILRLQIIVEKTYTFCLPLDIIMPSMDSAEL